MTDLIRESTSSLLQLSAGLVQCTGWLALICFPKAEMDLEKRLDKLLAGLLLCVSSTIEDQHHLPGKQRIPYNYQMLIPKHLPDIPDQKVHYNAQQRLLFHRLIAVFQSYTISPFSTPPFLSIPFYLDIDPISISDIPASLRSDIYLERIPLPDLR